MINKHPEIIILTKTTLSKLWSTPLSIKNSAISSFPARIATINKFSLNCKLKENETNYLMVKLNNNIKDICLSLNCYNILLKNRDIFNFFVRFKKICIPFMEAYTKGRLIHMICVCEFSVNKMVIVVVIDLKYMYKTFWKYIYMLVLFKFSRALVTDSSYST